MTGKGVRLFGRRPPSTRRELIPWTEIKPRVFKDGGKTLWNKFGKLPEFVDLEVSRSDLWRYRRVLREGAGSGPGQ